MTRLHPDSRKSLREHLRRLQARLAFLKRVGHGKAAHALRKRLEATRGLMS
jgi:hypothetical protein